MGDEYYMEDKLEDKLIEGLVALGFSSDVIDKISGALNSYIDELELFNSAIDLVGADNRDEIVVRHILDSISAWNEISALIDEHLRKCDSDGDKKIILCDVGSGGGLPGIPLAILCRELYSDKVQIKLIERMKKRCNFLENVVAVLGLQFVEVINLELERLMPHFTDIATFRAFRPLDKKMIKSLLRILKPAGHLAAYKAKREKISEEMSAIKSIVTDYKVLPLKVPFLQDTERNLVVVDAVA